MPVKEISASALSRAGQLKSSIIREKIAFFNENTVFVVSKNPTFSLKKDPIEMDTC